MSDYYKKQSGKSYFDVSSTDIQDTKIPISQNNRPTFDLDSYHKSETKIITKQYDIKPNK